MHKTCVTELCIFKCGTLTHVTRQLTFLYEGQSGVSDIEQISITVSSSSFQHLTHILYQFFQSLDPNREPLLTEATALPTEPQPLQDWKFI